MAANASDFDGALFKVLRNASEACNELAQGNVLNERTLTGAVLGALKASVSMQVELNVDMGWAIYNEGPADNDYSEGATGVDFGLLLVGETGLIRFTVFQAKRPTNVPQTHIRANRTRLVEGEEKSQLIDLRDASLELMRACKPAATIGVKELRWAHYLAYCQPIKGIALSEMQTEILQEETQPGTSEAFDATKRGQLFDAVLISGATMKSLVWLTIGSISQPHSLPAFFRQMPIAVITNSKGLALAHENWWEILFSTQAPQPGATGFGRSRKR